MKLSDLEGSLLMSAADICGIAKEHLKQGLKNEQGNPLELLAAVNALYDAQQLILKARRLLK